MQLVCLVRSEETQHCRHYRLCNSCPYLAVVIYVTRGSSLLNATSDDKWKGKDRRTIREERIRGDMRTTIGRDYLHWMHTHVKTIWKSMYRMGKYGWQERSGGVFFRVRVCVCLCVRVWLEKENEMSGGICVLRAEMNLNRKSLRGPAANHSNIIRTRQRDCASPRHRFCISLTTVNIHNNLIYILLIYI